MRSPWAAAAQASRVAARAAMTDFKAPRVAKKRLGPKSIRNITGRSRSSWKSFVCGRPGARGDPPVHIADIVTRLVGARFLVVHATSAKT